MAYVLGFFAADGSMILNKRGAAFIEFTTTDRILVEQVRRIVKSTHAIQVRDRGNEKWRVQYRLQIGSKEWFEDLTKLGFSQKKSKTLLFPPVPKRFLVDFIRGYFDGDGCVYVRLCRLSHSSSKVLVFSSLFTSGSEEFLRVLWDKLRKIGLKGGSLVKKNRGFELKFARNDSVALYKNLYHTGQGQIAFLPRKRRKFEQGLT